MKVQPTTTNKPQPTFGILKEYRKTGYGEYLRGVFKDKRIEVFDAYKHKQKLIYVSDNKLLKWVKSKLIYFQDGIKKVAKSVAKKDI